METRPEVIKMHDTYFFTDIHGRKDFFDAIMSYIKRQDPQATIVFGGDACDRGNYGYEIMRALLNNPQVVYLKGNHEDLFVKAARECLELMRSMDIKIEHFDDAHNLLYSVDSYSRNPISLHLYNGGNDTLVKWMVEGNADPNFIDEINKLPLTFSYGQYDFCHAGSTYENFSDAANDEYNNETVDKEVQRDILWDRESFNIPWKENRYVLHGHTPIIYLPFLTKEAEELFKKVPQPVFYNSKVDMDTGAVFSNHCFLMNCTTNQLIHFFKQDNEIRIIENASFYSIEIEED